MKVLKTGFVIILMIMLVSCALTVEKEDESKTLYKFIHPDQQLDYWLVDEQSIETGISSLVKATIESYWVTHDVEINLLGYEIVGDSIVLDLTSSFSNSFVISDTAKAVNILMLTNTICSNFQDIKSIQFIFDGETTKIIGDSLVNTIHYPNFQLTKVY